MKVGIFSYDSSYTVGGHLHRMIASLGFDTYSFFDVVDAKNFGLPPGDKLQLGLGNFTDPGIDMAIFMGSRVIMNVSGAYPNWFKDLCKRDVRTVLMDSHYMGNYEEQNIFYRKLGIKVFAMPDHIHLVPEDILMGEYHLPFPRMSYEGDKNEMMTISHSPGSLPKCKQKGSDYISAVVWKRKAKYELIYDLILYRTWEETLMRKAQSHIFVDQLIEEPHYRGGLGKSGIEGMLMGNVVLTSGASAAAIHIDSKNFKEQLIKCIEDESFRIGQIDKQNKWIDEYITSDYYPKLLTKV